MMDIEKKRVNLVLEVVELEHEIDSVKERIRDIEWRIDRGDTTVSHDHRQKAIDKQRWLSRELAEKRKELIKCESSV